VNLFLEVAAPRAGKFINKFFNVFEREENFLQNGILNFVLESLNLRRWKTDFYGRACHL